MRFSTKKVNPETVIKKSCLKYLQARYGRRFWFVNIIGGLGIRPGTPDTLICLDGKFISIEFKQPKGRLTPYQETALDNIFAAGGLALVIRSIDECIAIFKGIEGNQKELF